MRIHRSAGYQFRSPLPRNGDNFHISDNFLRAPSGTRGSLPKNAKQTGSRGWANNRDEGASSAFAFNARFLVLHFAIFSAATVSGRYLPRRRGLRKDLRARAPPPLAPPTPDRTVAPTASDPLLERLDARDARSRTPSQGKEHRQI